MNPDFTWSADCQESHVDRRHDIIKCYPEVKHLMGTEWRSKYIAIFGIFIPHLSFAVYSEHLNWPCYLLTVYFVGATHAQATFLAIHELSHNLVFKRPTLNRILGIVLNFPILFPFSVAFRFYHLKHHHSLGFDGVDVDIPSNWEAKHVRTRLQKFLWLSLQIFAYAIRPMMYYSVPVTGWLVVNWLAQIAFNIVLYAMFGITPFVYLLLSTFIAGGLHPCAGHFISEHYVFDTTVSQDTFSYYGVRNWLTWNVGYHVEHHDFPSIPCSRLPKLRVIASEFYDGLITCDSWCGILYDFVMADDMHLCCRVKRTSSKLL